MKNRITSLVFILIFQFMGHVFGQKFITIKGSIIDSKSMEPIGFASISLKDEPIGTICNANGAFILHIPDEKINDPLMVSSMGYQSCLLSVKSIENRELKIKLELKTYTLKEVVVKPLDPLELIKKKPFQ